MADKQKVNVSNNASASRFECSVDGKLCRIDYETRPGEIILTHTEVPQELSGRGIAQQMVTAALDHARQKKLRVVPLCGYVETFIERHPEYKDLVAD